MQPPKIRFTSRLFIPWINFFAILLCAISCDKPRSHVNNLSQDERTWMTNFFNDIMLEDEGIYTLLGSKPLTRIVLYHYTEDQKRDYYDKLSDEEKKNMRFIERDDLPENWNKWEAIQARFPLKRYLLFKEDLPDDPEASYVYFVDILKTAVTIQEHYDLFRKVVGFDFDPREVVLEMPRKDSNFWKKAGENSVLWGILFGYGNMNSWAFHWKHFAPSPAGADFDKILTPRSSDKFITGKTKITLENFSIPSFMSFDENDEVVQRYKKERRQIQKAYRGKDFLDFTLEALTRE
jgi:hypothetical protein